MFNPATLDYAELIDKLKPSASYHYPNWYDLTTKIFTNYDYYFGDLSAILYPEALEPADKQKVCETKEFRQVERTLRDLGYHATCDIDWITKQTIIYLCAEKRQQTGPFTASGNIGPP